MDGRSGGSVGRTKTLGMGSLWVFGTALGIGFGGTVLRTGLTSARGGLGAAGARRAL